jgi:hypothetical protein
VAHVCQKGWRETGRTRRPYDQVTQTTRRPVRGDREDAWAAAEVNGGGSQMIRAIVTLLVLGFMGMVVLSLLFGLLMPLLAIALKVGLVLVIGYFVLRIVSPKDAEKVREKLRRVK